MQDNGIAMHIAAVYAAVEALRQASLATTQREQAREYARQVSDMGAVIWHKLGTLQGKLNSYGYHDIR